MKAFLIALTSLICTSVYGQEYSTALMAAKMDLDSAWFDSKVPAADKVCLPLESHTLRKGMSKHDCLKMSIRTALKEGSEAAMPWLIAAFCYEQPAQDRVAKAGTEAVRYVMNQWGGGENAIAGRPKTPAETALKPVEMTVNFTNKTGDWLYMYGLMSEVSEGKEDCKNYKYLGKLAPNRSHMQVISKGKYSWMRFSDKMANDGCGPFKKEHKVGPAPDQSMSNASEIIIQ